MSPRVSIALLALTFGAGAFAEDAVPPTTAPAAPVTVAPAEVPAAGAPQAAPPAAASPAATSPAGMLPPGRAPANHGPAGAKAPVSVVATPARDISQLAWMHGCWAGTVNQRTFTEQWTAPAAGIMLGLGQTVKGDKNESFEFMRLETQPDGKIAYVLHTNTQTEDRFVFEGVRSEPDVDFFVFAKPGTDFPTRIVYGHASGGRLYVHVLGKVNGADHEVVYPFAPVNCATGKGV